MAGLGCGGVWWQCCWPVWNDRNVKGRNDWQTESWVHSGALLWRGGSHTAITSQRWNTNTRQHCRCWVRMRVCAFNKVCEEDTLQVMRTETKTVLNLLFSYFYFKIYKLQRAQRSHFRISLNFSKETTLTLSFVQRLNISPKTNQNEHTVFEPNSGYKKCNNLCVNMISIVNIQYRIRG